MLRRGAIPSTKGPSGYHKKPTTERPARSAKPGYAAPRSRPDPGHRPKPRGLLGCRPRLRPAKRLSAHVRRHPGWLWRGYLGVGIGECAGEPFHLAGEQVWRDGPGVVGFQELLPLAFDAGLAPRGSLRLRLGLSRASIPLPMYSNTRRMSVLHTIAKCTSAQSRIDASACAACWRMCRKRNPRRKLSNRMAPPVWDSGLSCRAIAGGIRQKAANKI